MVRSKYFQEIQEYSTMTIYWYFVDKYVLYIFSITLIDKKKFEISFLIL